MLVDGDPYASLQSGDLDPSTDSSVHRLQADVRQDRLSSLAIPQSQASISLPSLSHLPASNFEDAVFQSLIQNICLLAPPMDAVSDIVSPPNLPTDPASAGIPFAAK